MDDTHTERTSPNDEVLLHEEDEFFMKELIDKGFSQETSAPRHTAKQLARALYEGYSEEEESAMEYADRAIELYWVAYADRAEATADEARRLVAKYPGHFLYDGQPIIDAKVEWEGDEAHIRFITQESAMLDSVQEGESDESTDTSRND